MFTGIIEKLARVVAIRRTGAVAKLSVDLDEAVEGVRIGDSIAINGACLTAVSIAGTAVTFDAVEETLRRSTLGSLRAGDRVNIERSLKAGDRIGGHFVQGHVDAIGTLVEKRMGATDAVITISAPREILMLAVEKGSIAVDGISLTVAAVTESSFSVAVIPHTLTVTSLGDREPGSKVNLETDILARLVARLLARRGDMPEGITEELLREQGFA